MHDTNDDRAIFRALREPSRDGSDGRGVKVVELSLYFVKFLLLSRRVSDLH